MERRILRRERVGTRPRVKGTCLFDGFKKSIFFTFSESIIFQKYSLNRRFYVSINFKKIQLFPQHVFNFFNFKRVFLRTQRFQSPWSLELWIGLSDYYQILTSYSRYSFRASGRRIFFSTNAFYFTTKKRQFFSGNTQVFV